MRDEICTLITLYAAGAEQLEKQTEVFCRKQSATRSEFYSAYAVGLKPRFILCVDPGDWEASREGTASPTSVEYGGERLNIYRTFCSDEATLELTVG